MPPMLARLDDHEMSAFDRGCVITMNRIENEQFRFSIERHFESFVLPQML